MVQRIFDGPHRRWDSELKIPALSENVLRRSQATLFLFQLVLPPPLSFLPPFGFPSVKMADAKKVKTPKEFFGVYTFAHGLFRAVRQFGRGV